MTINVKNGDTIRTISTLGNTGNIITDYYLYFTFDASGIPSITYGPVRHELNSDETEIINSDFILDNFIVDTTYSLTISAQYPNGSEVGQGSKPNVIYIEEEVFVPSEVIASADAIVIYSNPNDNFGSVGNLSVASVAYYGLYHISYFKFSIPNIPIETAYFRIHVGYAQSGGNIAVRSSNDTTWTEGGITWNNKPGPSGNLYKTISFSTQTNYWVDIDVSNFIASKRGQEVTIFMEGISDGVWMYFDSKETGNKPRIVINPHIVPPSATIDFLSVNPASVTGEDNITITARIYNTGDSDYTFKFGCSIGNELDGIWYDINYYTDGYGDYRNVFVPAGTSVDTTRQMKVPVNTRIKDVWVSVNDPALNILDDEKISNVLNVSAPSYVILTDDAYTKNTSPDTNYGSSSSLKTTLDGSKVRDTHLKFYIPNVIINSAKLRLYVAHVGSGESGTIWVTNWNNIDWNENIITWNNAGLTGELDIDQYFSEAEGYWTNIDLTSFINAHKGEYITIVLIGKSEGVDVRFSSKEGINPPKLLIQ